MTREIGIQVTSAVIATKIQTNGNEYVKLFASFSFIIDGIPIRMVCGVCSV